MEPEIFGKLSKPVGCPQVFIAVIIGVVVSVLPQEREGQVFESSQSRAPTCQAHEVRAVEQILLR